MLEEGYFEVAAHLTFREEVGRNSCLRSSFQEGVNTLAAARAGSLAVLTVLCQVLRGLKKINSLN